MASDITPGNIDGTFPVAGIDNDSQGFRTNFTNTSTNFTEAKAEIEDLQAKVVLKAPLIGESVTDNDMLGEQLKAATLVDTREVMFAHGSLSGAVVVDHQSGQYQTVTTSGSIVLSFNNFPGTSGTPVLGRVRLAVDVTNLSHTVSFSSNVVNGIEFLDGRLFTLTVAQDETNYNGTAPNGSFVGGDGAGGNAYVALDVLTMSDGSTITIDTIDGNGDAATFTITTSGGATVPEGESVVQVSNAGTGNDTTFSITPGTANLSSTYVVGFAAIGIYEFEFTNTDNTSDYTVVDITRSKLRGSNPAIKNAAPASSAGISGDKSGDLAWDDTFLYVCIADFGSITKIWHRTLLDNASF